MMYSSMGKILHVNTDLGGVDGFLEVTNIECYTLPSKPPNINMATSLFNEFIIEVRCLKGNFIIDSLGLP